MSVIYKILCKQNQKFYIGQTCDLEKRKCKHLYDLRKNRHTNGYLQNCFNKYGEESFFFEILEECTFDLLTEREQYYLDQYFDTSLCLNLCPIAETCRGKRTYHPCKYCSRQREEYYGPDGKFRRYNYTCGSSECLEKQAQYRKEATSRANTGQKRPKSLEAREKISKALTGKSLSLEHKDSLKRAWDRRRKEGFSMPEEIRERISDTLKWINQEKRKLGNEN